MRGRRILLVLGAMAVLAQCYGLYSPSGPPSAPGLPLDKVGHLLGFAVPAALFVAARVDWRIVAGLAVLQAGASEVFQAFLLPGRSGDLWDVAADLIGTAIGCLVGWSVGRFVSAGSSGPAGRGSGSPSRS